MGGVIQDCSTAPCTALDPGTALYEANQVISLHPTLIVSSSADLGSIFDTHNQTELGRRGMLSAKLADPDWRSHRVGGNRVATQHFADRLIKDGFAGLLVQSYAKGASKSDFNIVLWRGSGPGCKLEVVDDANRLLQI